jgi:hypothetical protein
MKRKIVAVAAAAAFAAAFVPTMSAHAAEGCILTNPGADEPLDGTTNVGVTSCTYTASVEGTWGGAGTFTVEIDRGGDGTVDETYTEEHGATNPEGVVIAAGDVVHASVGVASTLAIGNAAEGGE